jgi:hypothetical protein
MVSPSIVAQDTLCVKKGQGDFHCRDGTVEDPCVPRRGEAAFVCNVTNAPHEQAVSHTHPKNTTSNSRRHERRRQNTEKRAGGHSEDDDHHKRKEHVAYVVDLQVLKELLMEAGGARSFGG